METKYTYLFVDIICIIFPLLFSFHPKISFYKEWRYYWLPASVSAAFFVLWDVVFTALGIWSFNPKYLIGIYVINLPIEELLFFFCIPYACTFTYFCIHKFYFTNKPSGKIHLILSYLLASVLIILGILNLNKFYTSTTFILTALFLFFLAFKKVNYLNAFYLSFLVILIPFMISNGVLTGNFTQEPVVIYNNNHNLNIRITTIPIEDTFYGMLLILMNVSGYNFLKKSV
jgi:lycopene cyclase domain-containing protein